MVVQRKTPGVYITEEDAFPPSIVGVQTSFPAFIGYTEKAEIAGKSVFNKPQKITSFAEYVSIFGKGFEAWFDIIETAENPDTVQVSFHDASGKRRCFQITQPTDNSFYLYASMKLFYDNGGEECYVVSVGAYFDATDPTKVAQIEEVNLATGLTAIGEIVGPTMLVCPDAMLLKPASKSEPFESTEFNAFWKKALKQCGQLQDRVAIIDVYGGQLLDQTSTDFTTDYNKAILNFRAGIGAKNLSYGAAYFPFLKTTAYPLNDINYTFFDPIKLRSVLSIQAKALYDDGSKQLVAVEKMMKRIGTDTPSQGDVNELNDGLLNALPILKELENAVAVQLGVLPPSGGIAGIYTQVDTNRGVWNAPANVSMTSVIAPTININNEMQGDLNVPLDGKAIDVIRQFPGRGTVVWGARTLLGNSNDWRYIQVRRTIIYIEQSIKSAMMPFVFAANDGKTWSTVVSAVSSFLQQTWSQGGLMGNTPQDAYSVECGLGSTMTSQDIMEGYMVVQVRLQMIRPDEFIELIIKQQMQEG